MLAVKNYKFWFCVGSQDLYGDEVLANVATHAKEMVAKLNESGKLPYEVIWKPTLLTNELSSESSAWLWPKWRWDRLPTAPARSVNG